MQLPVQVSFHNVPASSFIDERIREEVMRLNSFYPNIMGCRVVVDAPHKRHHEGKLYNIRIDLTVPGGEIVINRQPGIHSAEKDVNRKRETKSTEVHLIRKQVTSAINEAFDQARRMLQDYARKQRGDLKSHAGLPAARVAQLSVKKRQGILRTTTGRLIPFSADAVLTGFTKLKMDDKVRFVEEEVDKGARAVAVWSVKKGIQK